MQTTLQNYQSQIEAHITQTNPDATIGEVLGTQTIIPSNRPVLTAGLPYHLIEKGNTFKTLPVNLRHQFKFSLYVNETDRVLDNPALHLAKSLPELAGKRLTLSFEPASESDRQIIESYLPEVPGRDANEPNIRLVLEGSVYLTLQKSVSLPAIKRYVDRINSGEVNIPPIKVDGMIIVDGNHRYISGKLCDMEVPSIPYPAPPSKKPYAYPIQLILIDPFDWGNE